MPFHHEQQTTTPLDLQYSPTDELASLSFDSLSTKSSSRIGVNISPPQPSTIATTTQSPNPKNPTLVGVHSSRPEPQIAAKQNPNPNISTKVGNLQSNEDGDLISSTATMAAHPVLQIIDAQELGKQVLVLAIPMVMGLVSTSNPLAKSVEMQVEAVAVCCAL